MFTTISCIYLQQELLEYWRKRAAERLFATLQAGNTVVFGGGADRCDIQAYMYVAQSFGLKYIWS